jgi:hypothetical protein
LRLRPSLSTTAPPRARNAAIHGHEPINLQRPSPIVTRRAQSTSASWPAPSAMRTRPSSPAAPTRAPSTTAATTSACRRARWCSWTQAASEARRPFAVAHWCTHARCVAAPGGSEARRLSRRSEAGRPVPAAAPHWCTHACCVAAQSAIGSLTPPHYARYLSGRSLRAVPISSPFQQPHLGRHYQAPSHLHLPLLHLRPHPATLDPALTPTKVWRLRE